MGQLRQGRVAHLSKGLPLQDAAHAGALDLWAEDPPLRDAAARADDRGVRPRPTAPGLEVHLLIALSF